MNNHKSLGAIQPRNPNNTELAAMLEEAASRIVALCSKDIRKSFSDQNFAANTLRKPARQLATAQEGR